MPDSKKVNVVATLKAKTGHSDALRVHLEKLVEKSTREDGCIRYELNKSIDDESIFIFVETWASELILEIHDKGSALTTFRNSGALDLVESMNVHRLEKVAGI